MSNVNCLENEAMPQQSGNVCATRSYSCGSVLRYEPVSAAAPTHERKVRAKVPQIERRNVEK